MEEFSFTDEHGVEIHCYLWRAAKPVACVQIAHGVGEHALRYTHLAETLVAAGFTVVANDHRGHGRTGLGQHGGNHKLLGRLGPGGLTAAEQAITRLAHICGQKITPGLPVLLFAHSWGSLMAQRILERGEGAWQAVVLSGTAYRTLRHMESGQLNRRFRHEGSTGNEWLSRDLSVAEAFAADPLCFAPFLPATFGLADCLRLFGTPHRRPDVPLLIISGSDDPLSRGDGLARLARSYRQLGAADVTLHELPGMRHEIINEVGKEQVIEGIITWLLEHVDYE